jgi:hypothetical protein
MSLFCHCSGRHAIGTQSPCLKTRFIRPVRTGIFVIGLGIGSITRPRNSMRELKRWPNGIYRRGSSPGSRNGTAAGSKRLNPSNRTRCSIRRWSCSTTLALRESPKKERLALTACFLRRAGHLPANGSNPVHRPGSTRVAWRNENRVWPS